MSALRAHGGKLCGGFCRLALMGLASLCRALSLPFRIAASGLVGAARWFDGKAGGLRR